MHITRQKTEALIKVLFGVFAGVFVFLEERLDGGEVTGLRVVMFVELFIFIEGGMQELGF
jgi:hypothetical protein